MNTRTIYDYIIKDIDGVSVHFCQKNIKRLSVRITRNGDVVATRPLHTTLEQSENFVVANIDWIREKQLTARQKAEARATQSPLGKTEINAFMAKVSHIFPQCEAKMKLYASKVTVRRMTSRWGSCSIRRAVSINLELARYPDECLEYVIIHELAHIVHHNHSQAFWNLVEEYCPDWRRIRRSLR